MTTITGAKPHPIFLAGRWVESPDPLVIHNPARPDEPAGATYHATEEQYEEAVQAAVKAFDVTRNLPAYERGAILRNISSGIKSRRGGGCPPLPTPDRQTLPLSATPNGAGRL